MAIEAYHLNYLPSPKQVQNQTPSSLHLLDIMNNNVQMDFGLPLSGITTDSLLPFYTNNNSVPVDWMPEATMKADSGITYNNNNNNISFCTRKRSRDPLLDYNSLSRKLCRNTNCSVSFLGEDISLQLQQQQLETDRLIAQHMEKVRLMVSERRKENARRLVAVIDERMMKRLKEKDEEIEKAAKINWMLEEKVKTLFLENQMWRNIAETNEATANALRGNLEQILSHQINKEEEQGGAADDAESCCGSSGDREGAELMEKNKDSGRCRKCGKEESSVVILPCRHLCLCTFCAPTLHQCPICESNKSGSVHVNLS